MKTVLLLLAGLLTVLCWPAELVVWLVTKLWINPLQRASRWFVKRGR